MAVKKLLAVFACLLTVSGYGISPDFDLTPEIENGVLVYPVPPREPGQRDVLELRCDPLETVRIAVIGLGMRGSAMTLSFARVPDAVITVVCDKDEKAVRRTVRGLKSLGKPEPVAFTGADDWKGICTRNDVDLVCVFTPWVLHTPIAVEAMKNGKHVAVEVPAALTLRECWELVDTAEKTRRHCMMMENCNYDFFELATLNMAQQGLFGEIVHAEGAYIHDLRSMHFAEEGEEGHYSDMWRLKESEKRTGNLYPTHGLGPIAHIMNIHRGDKIDVLVSLSTKQFGMTEYAKRKFGEDSDYAKTDYKLGDMNTTVVRTEKGKTMMIQHDVTSPRPYSRIHLVSGTKGFAQKYPQEQIALDPHAHSPLSRTAMNRLIKKYEHPITTEYKKKAKLVGGHGGMDYILHSRLIYCLKNGLPLDQDVYDAAEWSAFCELTATAAAGNGVSVRFPDFTRGAWDRLPGVKYYMAGE
ncbi:MAG: Gfo/Idh/MocA family oxidoreductase [Spirochaetia bacterium]|nr:Gfo/Idh/MocA family oxidoreductase [Spirochaetia bacterium]